MNRTEEEKETRSGGPNASRKENGIQEEGGGKDSDRKDTALHLPCRQRRTFPYVRDGKPMVKW